VGTLHPSPHHEYGAWHTVLRDLSRTSSLSCVYSNHNLHMYTLNKVSTLLPLVLITSYCVGTSTYYYEQLYLCTINAHVPILHSMHWWFSRFLTAFYHTFSELWRVKRVTKIIFKIVCHLIFIEQENLSICSDKCKKVYVLCTEILLVRNGDQRICKKSTKQGFMKSCSHSSTTKHKKYF
jgi:hypothetical protein